MTVDPALVLTIAVVLGIVAWVQWRKTSAARKPVSAAPAESLGALLQRVGSSIDAFAQNASHPRELANFPDFQAAVAALSKPEVSLDALRDYALGANWPASCAAFAALSHHAERQTLFPALMGSFVKLWPWPIHFALQYLASLPNRPVVGAPVSCAQHWWANNAAIPASFRDYFVARESFGDWPLFGDYLNPPRGQPEHIEALLAAIDHPFALALREELRRWKATRIDGHYLSSIGRLWGIGEEDSALAEPKAWSELLDLAEEAILHNPPRSIVVSGEPRIGKTSFLKCLGRRLAIAGWSVFEASGVELMAGQSYFGELEGRIRRLLTELDSGRRVVWCVMDLLQIAESGTHQGQSASILDQILPALGSGRLVIMAEASPAGVSRLFQRRPSLRSVIEVCRLHPMDENETASLLREVAGLVTEGTRLRISEGAVTGTLQLCQHYLGLNQLPGIALDLLKRSTERALAAGETDLSTEGVLATLSQLTGLPLSILDDRERIDLSAIRKFFTARVIGQDEAVEAVVDRIAMLKAGLVDPKRPVGVFLFAGPTGTGKTELAKTLAEFLFGSPDRMARLDMSEFQTPESTVKILGERGFSENSDSLIERVRKQPFSVILLDEFEKAHPNVWDLFLQIFDDGRLTDANGRTGDFRHSIVILTSNLGAVTHRGSGLGFLPDGGTYSEDQVLRAVAQTFRPEFVNRLDKVIVFRPLSRQLMRSILHKELQQVLDRRGLRRRDWAVEWEESAIEFLLDRGFSPEMGARPLKRAIDHYLLAPLAITLVEHRFPEGDQFLFVRSDGKAIQVEFVDPDAESVETPAAGPNTAPSGLTLASVILQPNGAEDERELLASAWSNVEKRLASAEWNALKDRLYAEAGMPDVWSRPDRAALFGRVALVDRVAEAARTAERLFARLEGSGGRAGHSSREIAGRLALQLHLVEQGIEDVLAASPVDAVIAIEPLFDANGDEKASRAWCARLSAMYANWAARRHMQLSDIAAGDGHMSVRLVGGFGAYRALANEAGLHVWEDGEGARVVARVTVCAGPAEEPNKANAARVYNELLASAGEENFVVRRYRGEPAPLVRDARMGWRTGRLDTVLGGDFDLIGARDAGEEPRLAAR